MRLLLLLLVLASLLESRKRNQSTIKKPSRVDRFWEWLKWDAECKFLPPAEQEIRAAQGRCPPIPSTKATSAATTTTKKRSWWRRRRKPSKMTIINRKKQQLISLFSAGGQTRLEVDLSQDHMEYTVQEGAMLVVGCDVAGHGKYNCSETVSWHVNTNLIEVGIVDWRIMISEQQELIIWPMQMDDEGLFECSVNGFHRASGMVTVVTQKEALLTGLRNYTIVLGLFFLPCLFSIVYVQKSIMQPAPRTTKLDRMTAFLEKQILESRTAVKENIAKIVHGEAFEKRKKAVEQSLYSKMDEDGKPVRGNKDTIRTILEPPEEPPRSVKTISNRGPPKSTK